MDTIIILGIVFALGWYIGWHVHAVIIIKRLAENPEAVINMLEELKRIHSEERLQPARYSDEPPEEGVELKLEQHSGMYYAFRKDTDQFVAQGPTPEAVYTSLKARFPGETFWCKNPDKEHQTA